MKKQTQMSKTHYVRPTIRSYDRVNLLRQLGPARAYSHTRDVADDEFILFGTIPPRK